MAIASGLAIGMIFGATVHRTNYCMMGAIADITLNGDKSRLRAWLMAMAVAMLGVQALRLAGLLDLGEVMYLAPRMEWAGAIVGGVLFGFGMVLACGCGSRNLVNAGAGDLRAVVAIVFLAIFALMTLHGLIAPARVWLARATMLDLSALGLSSQGLVEGGAQLLGLPLAAWRPALALGLGGGALFYCLSDAKFRANRPHLIAGCIIGLLVICGWLVTAALAADGFADVRVMSLTFVAPVGEALQFLMLYTGWTANFAIATVGGVVLGSLLSSLQNGSFRILAFEDSYDLLRYAVGGALMGVGGVTALGCTVGQGITGISTLGATSFIATLSIAAGALLGSRYLEQRSFIGMVRSVLGGG